MIPPRMPGTIGQFRETLLQEFVDWSAAHITGDEKGFLTPSLTVAAMEKQGSNVTAPGVPTSYGNAEKLVTGDGIKP